MKHRPRLKRFLTIWTEYVFDQGKDGEEIDDVMTSLDEELMAGIENVIDEPNLHDEVWAQVQRGLNDFYTPRQ